ncbi:quinolinate synthase [Bathymodiolus japonicus methanotrophic gill symbiont]|uniref:quinolinate synthase NadA n=1 Tax=Bathymodiolus japonicus methanotrophic gill symbiont TaxID=113269 RepID=UPI001B4CA90F|nr:quinolinate synthase NadA [Bathymodiolus japonicus methanotrophic gill symbiont]GFO70958.1 quinolinate synthase [Bathymodiolus japonicus methanotrophic gill symbiont]
MTALAIQDYALLSDEECAIKIQQAKATLGKRCIVLGHHYQRDEVFQHADISGDSLKLSREAAESDAEYIVFCGVHFMAEVADILSRPEQIAILPDLAAGCSMADMANKVNVQRCWDELAKVIDVENTVTPVTYINSAADLKAFCGEHEGIVCTSSNARKILEWSFAKREKILFFPDQHLGRNTAFNMGIPLDEMVVWDFSKPMGGLTAEEIRQAKMILWGGYCSVHQVFKPEQIDAFLERYPETNVVAHPEACFEVCQKADYIGSTEVILKIVREAEPNTRWLVATELNLVNRLHDECKAEGKNVHFMSPALSMCSTMFRTDPQHLAWILENLVAGHVVNRIQVAEQEAQYAKVALDNMLSIKL